jgi:hypothetical protein
MKNYDLRILLIILGKVKQQELKLLSLELML